MTEPSRVTYHGSRQESSTGTGQLMPEESSFSRLISQTNPSVLGLAPLLGRSAPPNQGAGTSSRSTDPSYSLIIASTSLYTLFVGFIIASFVNDSWQETVLQITIASYAPIDVTLRSRSLTALLQESNNFLPMFLLWIAYFIIPTLFLIIMPLWMVGDLTTAWRGAPIRSTRHITEQSAMVAMLLVWLQAAHNVAMMNVTIQTSTGQLLVRHRSGAGWTTFCVGIMCCLAALVVLRFTHPLPSKDDLRSTSEGAETQENLTTPLLTATTLRSPPPEAFARFPLRHTAQQSHFEEEIVGMSVLEDPPSTPRLRAIRPALESPERVEVATRTFQSRIFYWQRVVIFQLALLSTVLWIPSMYIPIFSVQYHGLAAVFLSERQSFLFVWNLASPQQELAGGDRFYNNVIIFFVASMGLVLLPVAGTCLGVLVWLGDGSWSTSSRRILYALQPVLGSNVMLLPALMIAMPTLGLGDATQVCSKLFLDMDCLRLTGQLEVGSWLYALHSVVLLAFVHYTLQWCWKC